MKLVYSLKIRFRIILFQDGKWNQFLSSKKQNSYFEIDNLTSLICTENDTTRKLFLKLAAIACNEDQLYASPPCSTRGLTFLFQCIGIKKNRLEILVHHWRWYTSKQVNSNFFQILIVIKLNSTLNNSVK